jgi:hypothetical protein
MCRHELASGEHYNEVVPMTEDELAVAAAVNAV